MKRNQVVAALTGIVGISASIWAGTSYAAERPFNQHNPFSANQSFQFDEDLIAARISAFDYPSSVNPDFWADSARVHTELVNECVSAQGIAIPESATESDSAPSLGPNWLHLWLMPSSDYGVSSALTSPGAIDAIRGGLKDSELNNDVSTDYSDYDRAVFGAPEARIDIETSDGIVVSAPVGGCFGDATQKLYGVDDPADYERVYLSIPSLRIVQSKLESNPKVQKAVQAWAQCMGERGYIADSPDGLYDIMQGWVSGAARNTMQVSDIAVKENKLAGSDLVCRESSGLTEVARNQFISISDSELLGREGIGARYRKMVNHAQSVIESR